MNWHNVIAFLAFSFGVISFLGFLSYDVDRRSEKISWAFLVLALIFGSLAAGLS